MPATTKKTAATATKKQASAPTVPDSAFKTLNHLGEIVTSERVTIHVREVEIAGRREEDKPRRVFDVRQWVEGKNYKGYGKGISIPADQVEELRDFCDEYLKLQATRKEKKAAKKAKK